MADRPYLVALALLEQEGKRSLPLNGKSRSGRPASAAGDQSLLLLELPLEALQEALPRLKARWIGGGATAAFQAELAALAIRGWSVTIARYAPVGFSPWP